MRKGREIKITRGEYKGMKGWLDADAKQLKKQVYIIISIREGEDLGKRVWKSSIRSRSRPASWEEAIIDQHPDIDGKLDELANLLAKCEIGDNSQPMARIFMARMNEANQRQAAMGHRAVWRNTVFTTEGDQRTHQS
jgi:hypothetical protein